jgi:hypothetical protein
MRVEGREGEVGREGDGLDGEAAAGDVGEDGAAIGQDGAEEVGGVAVADVKENWWGAWWIVTATAATAAAAAAAAGELVFSLHFSTPRHVQYGRLPVLAQE